MNKKEETTIKDKEDKAEDKTEKIINDMYDEVTDPEFFKFENYGDKIAGLYIEKGHSTRYGFGLYTVKEKNGITKRFHGSQQLDDLMMQVELNTEIIVEYIDSKKTEHESDRKIFSVRRKK